MYNVFAQASFFQPTNPSMCYSQHLRLGDIKLHFSALLPGGKRALRKLKASEGRKQKALAPGVTVAGRRSGCQGNGAIPDGRQGQRQHPSVEWHLFGRPRPASNSEAAGPPRAAAPAALISVYHPFILLSIAPAPLIFLFALPFGASYQYRE